MYAEQRHPANSLTNERLTKLAWICAMKLKLSGVDVGERHPRRVRLKRIDVDVERQYGTAP